MTYFKSSAKNQKKPSIIKWVIYAALFLTALFIFIPRFLIHKAHTILDQEIPENSKTADTLPSKQIFTAYNFLQVARFFPMSEAKAVEGQKLILDYYFPLFKEDYNKLKFACVDNAISELRKANPDMEIDSIRTMALQTGWRKYPDAQALEEFRAKWDKYHKNYSHELPEYPRFIDPQHL